MMLSRTLVSQSKNFLDLGTGEGCIPLLMKLDAKVNILAADFNKKLMDELQEKFGDERGSFSFADLECFDEELCRDRDVILLNGTKFALSDAAISNIASAAQKHKVKEIWLTTNHVFEWNFKKDRSYLLNLARMLLRPKSFKKGRLIGYYRSQTLLSNLLRPYCLVERVVGGGDERLFLKYVRV